VRSKRKHGHCNVPRTYPPNQQLAYWVAKQRASKKKGKLDRKTIRRLNELGFCWSLLRRRFYRRDLDEFVALVTAFKKRHGHCNLIAAYEGVDQDLQAWLKDVRKSKNQGRLDPQRVRQLDRLGFVWEPRKQQRRVNSDSPLLPIFSRMTFANPSASSVPTRMILRPSVSFTQAKPQPL